MHTKLRSDGLVVEVGWVWGVCVGGGGGGTEGRVGVFAFCSDGYIFKPHLHTYQ